MEKVSLDLWLDGVCCYLSIVYTRRKSWRMDMFIFIVWSCLDYFWKDILGSENSGRFFGRNLGGWGWGGKESYFLFFVLRFF